MGELEKEKGAWGYVEGGMGGVSRAIASSARSLGVDIFTEKVISVYFFFCSLFCSLIKKIIQLVSLEGCGTDPCWFRLCCQGSGAERRHGDPQQSCFIKRHPVRYLQQANTAGITEKQETPRGPAPDII